MRREGGGGVVDVVLLNKKVLNVTRPVGKSSQKLVVNPANAKPNYATT